MSALTCISVILTEICFGHSDSDYTFYTMKLFCLQLDPCIFNTLSERKDELFPVSDQSVCRHSHFFSALEQKIWFNVFVVDASFT